MWIIYRITSLCAIQLLDRSLQGRILQKDADDGAMKSTVDSDAGESLCVMWASLHTFVRNEDCIAYIILRTYMTSEDIYSFHQLCHNHIIWKDILHNLYDNTMEVL